MEKGGAKEADKGKKNLDKEEQNPKQREPRETKRAAIKAF